MLWGRLFKRTCVYPVTGFLVAVLFWQMTYDFLGPNFISSFINKAEAAYNTIQPNGNGTTAGTPTSCGAGGNFDCLNDGVATSSAPGTGGDFITFSDVQQDYYAMTTLGSVSSASTIYVPVYHVEGATSMAMYVSLWDAAEAVQYGSEVQFANRSASQWDTASFTGLSLNQSQIDGLKVRIRCQRPGGGKKDNCQAFAAFATVQYTEVIDVTVASLGNQQNLEVGTTSAFVGGAFSIVEGGSSRNITSITIAEQGTVDAQTDLDNIKLYYELDTSSPYDCSGLTYNGTETQFGATDTDGFSGANGTSVFTDSVNITTTQAMCVYTVLDVLDTATFDETIEIQITNPTTDVVGSGSPTISPATAVLLPSTTNLEAAVVTQVTYHWRNDDGNEGDGVLGATSATVGNATTSYDAMSKNVTNRLRFVVSNEGNISSDPIQYRLEYATKVSTCDDATGWTDVDSVGGDFDMSNTLNLTDGNNTTNIAAAKGGVSDPNTTFLTPNSAVKDTSSQTGNITLTSSEYVDIEYSIIASTGVADGTSFCFRLTDAGTTIDSYLNYAEATIAADVTVDSIGSQTATVNIPATNEYTGGAFRFTDATAGAGTISSLTITASGTVDYENDLSNIIVRYDLDITNPYTCDDTAYSALDLQYGSTDADGFSANGTSTFTGSVSNSPTQTVCFYVSYNLGSGATNGETLDIRIADPSSDVTIAGSTIAPASPVDISGMTTFAAPFVSQADYHWRDNTGNESGAKSSTAGVENTVIEDIAKLSTYRIRLGVSNTGLASTPSTAYRLEWAQKVTTCESATGWARVDTASDDWAMSPGGNITDGTDATDIAESIGGVSDSANTFFTNGNGLKDDNDTTTGSVMPADNYLDLEYSITPTINSVQGATYCFRVTDSGTELDSYTNYPEATIRLDTDFKIQRGVSTLTGDTITINAGTDYDAPSSASSSFIRITNTQLSGAGPNTGNGNSNADDVTVYITNPNNLLSNIVFQRGTGAAGNTRIHWEIIEYTGPAGGENEMIVRHQNVVTYGSGNTTASGPTVSTVTDNADVVAFITSQYNPNAGRNSYNLGLSTAAWNTTNDQVDLTRGGTGEASITSYSLVEFTGSNWKVQRVTHTYSAVGVTETEAIPAAVNSLSRTFVHVQKRTTDTNHADYGHAVWLSGIGQVSFVIDGAAATAANNTSVAWIIENTQTIGAKMDVTRSNGTLGNAGTGPETNSLSIGKTLTDISIASIFTNNFSDDAVRSWPEPILGVRIASTTHYELWRSDATANISYRTEVVEWPTAARKLEQNYFRLYVDNDALKPTDPWPVGGTDLGENTEMTVDDVPMVLGDNIRIRMTVSVVGAAMPESLDSFKLQFAKRVSTCSAASVWSDLGDIGSTTALWRGVANTPVDGAALSTDPPTGSDLVISIATVAGTYEEQNNTAVNPFTAFPGDEVEYDWAIEHNGAADKSSYCFRMTEADGTLLASYNFYPVLRTVGYEPLITNWRWYDDETSLTPSSPLAVENVAPVDVVNDNALKLRLVLREASGAAGTDLKFALQFSEYADFSQNVATVTASTTCLGDSLWCFFDGNGVDNELVDGVVISDADSCVSGTGNGCGSHNEGTSTVGAIVDQPAFASTEYEFTIKHAGARANAVYYFRLYDMINDEFVSLDSGSSYPSLVTEGAQLVSTMSGVTSGTTIAGVTSDITTTPSAIGFGSLPVNTSYEGIQQLSINTNATEGYQLLMYASQQLTNSSGETIPAITSTNAVPAGWSSACDTGVATGCFGYHTTDATLFDGNQGRFGPIDSYAAVSTEPLEIMHSSIPADDVENIIYRIFVSELQSAGDYETSITYIAIPTF